MNAIKSAHDLLTNNPSAPHARTFVRKLPKLLRMTVIFLMPILIASDHADPIDPFNKERLEGGITDLFVFPVDENLKLVHRFIREDKVSLADPFRDPRKKLKPAEQSQIKGLVVILCVRRALTEAERGSLQLEPYTYRINFDQHTPITFEGSKEDEAKVTPTTAPPGYQAPTKNTEISIQEARARYGGKITKSDSTGIGADISIAIRLKNDTSLNGLPKVESRRNFNKPVVYDTLKEMEKRELNISENFVIHSGVHDDPFIFPAFFGTNVVAVVMHIPIALFADDKTDWLIWATSERDGRQVDHVGRSLRTQNPRFEILNKVHPKDHVATIEKADKNPSLLRDLGLRFNAQQLAYYRSWDFVPDVMIYSKQYQVGFPNGRMLGDDVAAQLAQFGDTLLFELSYQHPKGGWPRSTVNDKAFHNAKKEEPWNAEFPYLAEPWTTPTPAPPPPLTPQSLAKIGGFIAAAAVVLIAVGFLAARWHYMKKYGPRPL